MSNIVKKIAENAKEHHKLELVTMYSTLIGTIVATVGVINGVTVDEQLDYFKSLIPMSKELPNTVKGLCDYVWRSIGKTENIPLRANMVLLTDNENKRSPMVSIVSGNEEDGYTVMPLSPDGFAVGLIGLARDNNKVRDNIEVEFIYDEDGMDYIEAEFEEIA